MAPAQLYLLVFSLAFKIHLYLCIVFQLHVQYTSMPGKMFGIVVKFNQLYSQNFETD